MRCLRCVSKISNLGQLEDLANTVHEMVGFFVRLQKRMDKKGFPRDRMYEVVTDAADKIHTLWVHLHYLHCDVARRERDKFGDRRRRPK